MFDKSNASEAEEKSMAVSMTHNASIRTQARCIAFGQTTADFEVYQQRFAGL